jgi:hypothetical protein
MKRKEFYTFSILLLLAVLFFISAQIRITQSRSGLTYQMRVSAAPIPPELLKALAGEFKGVVADYLLLEAASFIGGRIKGDEMQWAAVARLLEQSSFLDPYFKQTYIMAQGTLPWHAEKVQETMAILERSKTHRVWDWQPGFWLGFNHFYFLKDNSRASQELMQASQIPGAPVALATWGSRLASKAGEFQVAVDFLKTMVENTEDEKQKTLLNDRITAITGAHRLQEAVERYKDQFGEFPESLDELTARSVLSEIPANPYHRPYSLKDGIVEF